MVTGFLETADRLRLLYAKRAIYAQMQELLDSDKGRGLVGLSKVDPVAILDVLADLDSNCLASVVEEIDRIEESEVCSLDQSEKPKEKKVKKAKKAKKVREVVSAKTKRKKKKVKTEIHRG